MRRMRRAAEQGSPAIRCINRIANTVPGHAAEQAILPQRPMPRMDQHFTPRFISEGGEMGALMRAHDWSASPLGLPATWPPPLRMAMRLLLTNQHPMYIFWGAAGLCFYNDAYRHSVGYEHPQQPALVHLADGG